MATYEASAQWDGGLEDGNGTLRVGSGTFEVAMSPKPQDGRATNPEEVVGAALAGCYSLMLAKTLGQSGQVPKTIRTTAKVELKQEGDAFQISGIGLDVEVDVDGLTENELQDLAKKADNACPVSKALSATEIEIRSSLAGAVATS